MSSAQRTAIVDAAEARPLAWAQLLGEGGQHAGHIGIPREAAAGRLRFLDRWAAGVELAVLRSPEQEGAVHVALIQVGDPPELTLILPLPQLGALIGALAELRSEGARQLLALTRGASLEEIKPAASSGPARRETLPKREELVRVVLRCSIAGCGRRAAYMRDDQQPFCSLHAAENDALPAGEGEA